MVFGELPEIKMLAFKMVIKMVTLRKKADSKLSRDF